MSGVPSTRDLDWKGREYKESRKNWYDNWDRVFNEKSKDEYAGEDNSEQKD